MLSFKVQTSPFIFALFKWFVDSFVMSFLPLSLCFFTPYLMSFLSFFFSSSTTFLSLPSPRSLFHSSIQILYFGHQGRFSAPFPLSVKSLKSAPITVLVPEINNLVPMQLDLHTRGKRSCFFFCFLSFKKKNNLKLFLLVMLPFHIHSPEFSLS